MTKIFGKILTFVKRIEFESLLKIGIFNGFEVAI